MHGERGRTCPLMILMDVVRLPSLHYARDRPPRVSLFGMAGGGTRYNSGVVQETQDIEIMEYLSTEPNRPRFAWFETKAVQRPEIGVSAVSEVRSPPLNPFEIKRNFGAQIGK